MANQVNRAEQLWKNWEEKQGKLESINGIDMNDKDNLKFKYDFLRKGMYRISSNPAEQEKLYLHVIKTVVAKLEKRLYPSLLQRLLLRIYKQMVDKPSYLREFEKNKKENFEQLKADLKSTGLDFFVNGLETFLDYETPKISVGIQSRMNDNNGLQIIVEMEKDRFGSYHFNGYTATLTDEHSKENTAFFSKESQISLNEATNLLQGRAVLKGYADDDGTITKKWTQIDFGNDDLKIEILSPTIDYDLKKILIDHATELGAYGITREVVQRGLEQGSLVGFEIQGKGTFYLQAHPAEATLKFSDGLKKEISFLELKKHVNEPKHEKSMNFRLIKQNDVQQDNNLSISR